MVLSQEHVWLCFFAQGIHLKTSNMSLMPHTKWGMYQQGLDRVVDQHWQSLCHSVSEKDTGVPFVNGAAYPECGEQFLFFVLFFVTRKRNYLNLKHSQLHNVAGSKAKMFHRHAKTADNKVLLLIG